MKSVVTRFAPSPTGYLHIGGVRAGLYNYMFAKKHGGKFILRIEDTDKVRSKQEYTDDIIETFKVLGINPDEIHYQSSLVSSHKEHIERLIKEDKAYVSEETEGESKSVIRFRNTNEIVTFVDHIRGTVSVDTSDLGDFIIAKDLETPLHHLAVVVDDNEMSVTHAIRGEDLLSNTPRQILIARALGMEPPEYAHLPLIMSPDGGKLSKRHGAVSARDFIAQGYLPEALINYMALLGWSPQSKNGSEANDFLSLDEIIKLFDLSDVQKKGAVFSYDKLRSLNKQHMLALNPESQLARVKDVLPDEYTPIIQKIVPYILERISVFSDILELESNGELRYFVDPVKPSSQMLVGKNNESLEEAQKHLATVKQKIEGISNIQYNSESVKSAIWDYATEQGRGNVLWPLRIALSGRERSADPFTIASIIGKDETLERIDNALAL